MTTTRQQRAEKRLVLSSLLAGLALAPALNIGMTFGVLHPYFLVCSAAFFVFQVHAAISAVGFCLREISNLHPLRRYTIPFQGAALLTLGVSVVLTLLPITASDA